MAEVWFKPSETERAEPVTKDNPLPVEEMGLGKYWAPLTGAAEAITVAATSIGLSETRYRGLIGEPGMAGRAIANLETAQIRYYWDGTVPTATAGHVAEAGDELIIEGLEALEKFRAIRTGGVSATLNVTYEKRRAL